MFVGELWPLEVAVEAFRRSQVDLERHVVEGESPVLGAVVRSLGRLRRVGLFGNAAQSGW